MRYPVAAIYILAEDQTTRIPTRRGAPPSHATMDDARSHLLASLPRWLAVAAVSLAAGSPGAGVATAQNADAIPDDLRGNETVIARGILDGNLIETNFRNHGELSRWNDLPWGVWPRGIGGRHIDGIAALLTGQVPGERIKWQHLGVYANARTDTTLNPVILTYRDFGKRTGPSGELWGWLPLPGFNNPNRLDPITPTRTPVPALSSDPTSWPAFWPDRLDSPDDPGWRNDRIDQNPGRAAWNGFFGKGVLNADLESYYVMDDHSDMEYAIDPVTRLPHNEFGVYYPSPSDSTMGGLGILNQVRIFQWANVLAEDVMFILYRFFNRGETNHDRVYFAQIMDYGLGNEEGDEIGAYDPVQDVAYGWDQDGIGTRASGGTYDLGYTGFAFLESPARAFDGLDNDEDGMTDESRFNGPGSLIEGSAQILAAAMSTLDVTLFVQKHGPIEERPAYRAGRWWTGDENMDWVGYDDGNGNGQWDPGEQVNNDVGRDGLGPFDLGYPGPDDGQADGIPTLGEPNFDELDVDESDQVGLTGFDLNTRPFYESGDNLRDDTWLWDRVFNVAQFPLGTEPEAIEADIEPFLLFSSGPVDLPPKTTDFFSTAWIFGSDERDFFKNRRTVQNIFNADYTFAQPPFTPTLTAVPGDGQVVLSWDTLAIASFDRFSQEFDFEGFKLYKGTDILLSDAKGITDVTGEGTFFEAIAQFDLDNGISGPRTVLEGNAVYYMGDDTGLQFFYVDEDVTNGITYYYALVAYDRGAGTIDPQENTFRISATQAGNITGFTKNAAVVTPRSLAAGYVEGGTHESLEKVNGGIGTGSMSVRLFQEELADFDTFYRLDLFSTPDPVNADLYTTSRYQVTRLSDGEVVFGPTTWTDVTPPIEGFIVSFANDTLAVLDEERTGYVSNPGTANESFSTDPTTLDGFSTGWVANVREDSTGSHAPAAWDYELRWVDPADSLYRPSRVFGFLREDIPIFAVNVTKQSPADLLIEDRNASGAFDLGDDLILFERPGGQGARLFRYRIGFSSQGDTAPPSPGDVLRISVSRPFATGDFFQFSLKPSSIDHDMARSTLEEIAVVPNPYVGASAYEPRTQIEGRGERRVQFINLPSQCTIRIFNLRGELIRTLEHDGGTSDGAEFWDLRTEDQQDVAFGVYIFHVDAPEIGEHVGKFALIK